MRRKQSVTITGNFKNKPMLSNFHFTLDLLQLPSLQKNFLPLQGYGSFLKERAHESKSGILPPSDQKLKINHAQNQQEELMSPSSARGSSGLPIIRDSLRIRQTEITLNHALTTSTHCRHTLTHTYTHCTSLHQTVPLSNT